ncbi:uncharacterized protein LOC130991014 [Salvia miltiorrhiza]|uniref:uncharacterized protein LOC130991014 n=1 Tax=Salvia miltiorrhiza TaxID=226208 RepID=UPI0025AC73CC|nr:uncharacterized protein LOC130991014 [Salvia miltiorrhiza]
MLYGGSRARGSIALPLLTRPTPEFQFASPELLQRLGRSGAAVSCPLNGRSGPGNRGWGRTAVRGAEAGEDLVVLAAELGGFAAETLDLKRCSRIRRRRGAAWCTEAVASKSEYYTEDDFLDGLSCCHGLGELLFRSSGTRVLEPHSFLWGASCGTRVLELVKKHNSPGLLWKRIKLTSTRKANAKKRLRRVWQNEAVLRAYAETPPQEVSRAEGSGNIAKDNQSPQG